MSREILQRVAEWPLEAKDDSIKYFLETGSSAAIEAGSKIFVIGRKGTGKTAIAEHVHRNSRENVYSSLNSFKNFPFNVLYAYENNRYTNPNRYISIWKYVMLTSVCKLMAKNPRINYDARSKLSTLFNFDIEDAFERRLNKITDRSFEVNILGVGLASGERPAAATSELSIDTKCEIIEKFIVDNIDGAKYFILFDELDEDYQDILSRNRTDSNYFELIVGLFKAAQEIHSRFSKAGFDVRPVAFLRDDIFDLLRDHDKPKWRDKAVDLNWNASSLKDLLAHRIEAADGGIAGADFRASWLKLFSVETTRINNRHEKTMPTMSYILRSTYMRPRDVISYVRECAKISLGDGFDRINNVAVKAAETVHSEFIRNEIIAEMYAIVPHISEVLDMLSEIRKQIITRKEFNDNYRSVLKVVSPDLRVITEQRILELLYYFGVIGNITTANHQIFKYDSARSKYNRRENICIHRSILKALDIY